MPPNTAALFSSAVPCARLLEANLGVSGLMLTIAKRPLLSNIANPVPLGPNTLTRLPSGRMLTFDTLLHVPTRSLAVWAAANCGNAAPIVSEMAESVIILFMGVPLYCHHSRMRPATACRSPARRRRKALLPRGLKPASRRLLGSSEDVIDLAAGDRNWITILQFVGCDRNDGSFLVSQQQVRERAGFEPEYEALVAFVDRIGAEVTDRAAHNGLGFLKRRGRRVTGRDLRKVGTRVHHKDATTGVEDIDSLRICAEALELAAIGICLLPRDQCPGSTKLILEGFLLANCTALQHGEPQCSDH